MAYPQLSLLNDFIANNDRNIGNLVITLDGSIGIIDHGEILGRIDWLQYSNRLLNEEYFSNTLLNIVNTYSP